MTVRQKNIYSSAQFVWNIGATCIDTNQNASPTASDRAVKKSTVQVATDTFSLEPLKKCIDGVSTDSNKSNMFLEVNVVRDMQTATIEQIHRYKQLHLKHVDKLPAIRKLSRDQGLVKSCAFKEFRFEPPFVAKKRDKKKKKLPPIPEYMLPRRHNSFEEEVDESMDTEAPTLPSLSISPAFITEKPEERSISVEAHGKSPQPGYYNNREFTFPESSAKRKKHVSSQPSIVPALTPRTRDMPLQAKIEKLAKQKRKERAKRSTDKRYEKKLHNMMDLPPAHTHMAFRPHREPEVTNTFQLKDQKPFPFKQMSRSPDESDKSRIPPRLYTRIVDSIYSYTKGIHEGGEGNSRPGPYERLMVTPVTTKEEGKEELGRQLTILPPIV